MSLVPDMFEYEGPLELTEYYVRKTELRSEFGDLLRVEVEGGEIKFDDINIPVIDCHTEETVQSDSHNIPAYNSHEYHRSYVQLLQGRFFPPSHGFKRDCHVSSNNTFS